MSETHNHHQAIELLIKDNVQLREQLDLALITETILKRALIKLLHETSLSNLIEVDVEDIELLGPDNQTKLKTIRIKCLGDDSLDIEPIE